MLIYTAFTQRRVVGGVWSLPPLGQGSASTSKKNQQFTPEVKKPAGSPDKCVTAAGSWSVQRKAAQTVVAWIQHQTLSHPCSPHLQIKHKRLGSRFDGRHVFPSSFKKRTFNRPDREGARLHGPQISVSVVI